MVVQKQMARQANIEIKLSFLPKCSKTATIIKLISVRSLIQFNWIILTFYLLQITLGSNVESGPTVATIHYRYRSRATGGGMAIIMIHEYDQENDIMVPGPEIRVRGNFTAYQYTFHLDGVKIAQVQKLKTQFKTLLRHVPFCISSTIL